MGGDTTAQPRRRAGARATRSGSGALALLPRVPGGAGRANCLLLRYTQALITQISQTAGVQPPARGRAAPLPLAAAHARPGAAGGSGADHPGVPRPHAGGAPRGRHRWRPGACKRPGLIRYVARPHHDPRPPRPGSDGMRVLWGGAGRIHPAARVRLGGRPPGSGVCGGARTGAPARHTLVGDVLVLCTDDSERRTILWRGPAPGGGGALTQKKGPHVARACARAADRQPAARGAAPPPPSPAAGVPGARRLTVGARPRRPWGADTPGVFPDGRRRGVAGPSQRSCARGRRDGGGRRPGRALPGGRRADGRGRGDRAGRGHGPAAGGPGAAARGPALGGAAGTGGPVHRGTRAGSSRSRRPAVSCMAWKRGWGAGCS